MILFEEECVKKKKPKSIMRKAKDKTQRNQIFAAQKSVAKNILKLYDKGTDIINASVNKHTYHRDLEADVFDKSENPDSEPKPPFEESISKRTNMGRQKKSGKENQEGQVLTILTPDQMISRLQISLAQLRLKAGNLLRGDLTILGHNGST